MKASQKKEFDPYDLINSAKKYVDDQKNDPYDLIKKAEEEVKKTEEMSLSERALKNLSEDVVEDTYGEKKLADKVEKSPKKTDAQLEKDAEEHRRFLRSIAVGAAKVPGGVVDSLIGLAASPWTIPNYVISKEESPIPSLADWTEKGLHKITGDKLKDYNPKDASWVQTVGDLAISPYALTKALGTGGTKLLNTIAKAIPVGSAAKLAGDVAAENLDQDTVLGRLGTVLAPFGVSGASSPSLRKKVIKQLEKPSKYTKGVSIDAYKANEKIGAPRLISADANIDTPEGRYLAKNVQYHLENSPQLQDVASKGFDFYRDVFGVKGKDKKNPEKVGGQLFSLFEERHKGIKDKSNKAIEKVTEGLESISDKKKSSVSKKAQEDSLAKILKEPKLAKQFFDLNSNERVKFLNDFIDKDAGKSKFNFLEKSVTLANENDPRLMNSSGIVPTETLKTLREIYQDKDVPGKVSELFKVLDKKDGLTSIKHLAEWKREYAQWQKKLAFEKELDDTASKSRAIAINKSVNDDIYNRLKDLDKTNKTNRHDEFQTYNKTYRDFFEEMTPESIQLLHKNAKNTSELFNIFSDALTQKQSKNNHKMRSGESINNFFNKLPLPVKKNMINEMIYEMGANSGQRQWSPTKFKLELFEMSEPRQAQMNKLFSLAYPNSKLSLEDYAMGIHRTGNSLEYKNTSQSSVRNEMTMKEMQSDKNMQKLAKDILSKKDILAMGAQAAGSSIVKLKRLMRKNYYDKNYKSGDSYDKAIKKKIKFDKKEKSGEYKINYKELLNDLLLGTIGNK